MNIEFATCNRKEALKRIQQVYPNQEIYDTPDSAGILLDYVEKDLIRIQDPFMYGKRIQVVPGKKWIENNEIRKNIIDACKIFHK
jgi:hypothetical protein